MSLLLNYMKVWNGDGAFVCLFIVCLYFLEGKGGGAFSFVFFKFSVIFSFFYINIAHHFLFLLFYVWLIFLCANFSIVNISNHYFLFCYPHPDPLISIGYLRKSYECLNNSTGQRKNNHRIWIDKKVLKITAFFLKIQSYIVYFWKHDFPDISLRCWVDILSSWRISKVSFWKTHNDCFQVIFVF